MAGQGEGEGSLTTAMVIPLASVVGWSQRKAQWADVAWLAMRVHAGKVARGLRGGVANVVDVKAEDVDAPPATRGSKRKAPPDTDAPPSKAPRTGTPAQAAFAAATCEPVRGNVSQWLQHQQSDPW